jgi:molecular chaperone GrpE
MSEQSQQHTPPGAAAAEQAGSAPETVAASVEPSLESLLAEAENARKRAQAEVANAHKYALEKFAQALLPVVDSLEASLGVDNASVDALKGGAELTLKQLHAALGKESIAEIAPAAGERFDPHWHQAMAAVEVAGAEPNSVVSVMQKGWRLHDRVLRPALVTVAKAPPANDA